MKKLLTCISFIICFHISEAQIVSNYSIDVEFFSEEAQMWGYKVSEQSFMQGSATIEFSEINRDELAFYLHGELKIDSIVSANSQLNYSSDKVLYEEDYSYVALLTTVASSEIQDRTITIHYSGFINPSNARSLSDYMRINKNEGVFLRGHYYSPWFPIFVQSGEDDYEANFKEIKVKLPDNFKAVVAGELINESVEEGFYTSVWNPGKSRISNIQLTARPYETISNGHTHVYFVDHVNSGETIIAFTQKLKKLYTSHLRNNNDSSSLYIIEMPEYGNISSQNVIGLSSRIYNNFNTDLHSRLTIAHELVHPYVSIPVEKENPFFALIVEGFPSFFHLYGIERITSDGSFDLHTYMKKLEKGYLSKKQSGKDRRGNALPAEKPILNISFDEIGDYKDLFILSDRARLFLYDLWTEMGNDQFDQFLKELFQLDSINYRVFEKLVLKYLPNYKNDLNTWLNTNDYPNPLASKPK